MHHQIDESYLYHYEREQAELEQAAGADGRTAELHAELARLHRARRDSLTFIERLASHQLGHRTGFAGTDKEA